MIQSKMPAMLLPVLFSFGRGLLLIFALTLPFELDEPLLGVGPLAVTNVELFLGLILLAAGAVWLGQRQSWPVPHGGWVLLLASGLLFVGTAVLAPELSANALKASLRLLSGMALALAVSLLVRQPKQRLWLLLSLMAGGLLAAAIGLAEVWQNREFGWLVPVRGGITVTGEFLRLTGPLDYANHAAMLIEVTVPLLLVGCWLWWRRTKKTAVLLVSLAAMVLLLQASFQTLSRAGFTTIGAVATFFALGLGWWRAEARPWLLLAGLVVILFGLNTLGSAVFRLRFASEGDNAWYQTDWEVPDTLTLVANKTEAVPITVTNDGALIWRSDRTAPIQLGGRWILVERGLQLAEPRWPFDRPVAPGETVSLEVPLRAPAIPGEYTLVWDVVQEQVTWFGAKSGVFATSKVHVLPPAEDSPAPRPETAVPAWRYELPIPGRLTLWGLALQLIGERPLLGIGLDNFRLVYGRLLSASSWNETIHTNNWYLEFLVGGGLLAALPFFAWLAWEARLGWRALHRQPVDPWMLAILAGLLAFVVHGLLDFFLLFNSTGLLFWLLVGLWWQSLGCANKAVTDRNKNWPRNSANS